MTLNVEKYRPYLDEFDLSDDQKTEMIEALWTIAEAAADMAYGVDAAQLLRAANDNDSDSNSNVINLFDRFAAMPLPPELEKIMPPLEAGNDNQKED